MEESTGDRGLRRDSCRTDVVMCKCDELSSCRRPQYSCPRRDSGILKHTG